MAAEEIAARQVRTRPRFYRVMRFLASMGVFKEEQGKRFALTPACCLCDCLGGRDSTSRPHARSRAFTVIQRLLCPQVTANTIDFAVFAYDRSPKTDVPS
jgi:hypothetical protein